MKKVSTIITMAQHGAVVPLTLGAVAMSNAVEDPYMQKYMTIGQVADRLDVPPRIISDLIYRRRVDITHCPMVGTRRLIERDYVPAIRATLRRLRRPTRQTAVGG